MQMYIREIKEIYPLVYERIVAQCRENLEGRSLDGVDVNYAIIWSSTVEGDAFWDAVYRENWDLAKSLQPDLFEEINQAFTVKNNGLFKQNV